jgi:two-component system, OmpR family, sensor histidine kinase MtrB
VKRIPTGGRLRRRLAVTFALVAAISTGALALGTYLLVSRSRMDASVSSSLAQARTNLVLAGTLLGGSSEPQDVSDLLAFYGRGPGDFKTVVVAGEAAYGSSLGRAQISADLRELVQTGDLAYERVRIADTPYLVAGGRPPPSRAELYYFFSEAALHDDLAQLRTILLTGWAIVVALSAAAGALVARRLLRPVGRASAAAHALAEGLLETRLPVENDDEFGVWAMSFNEMAEALEAKIRALSEAQAREQRFTSDVAHELRTPVTALAGEAALLGAHIERMPLEAKRPAQLLVEDVSRLRRLVEELMEISRLDAGGEDVRAQPVDLGVLVDGIIRSRGWGAGVSLEASPVILETDPRRVERIVSNLVGNAVTHGGRDVAVQIRREDDGAVVEVSDRGPGAGSVSRSRWRTHGSSEAGSTSGASSEPARASRSRCLLQIRYAAVPTPLQE